MSKARAFLLLGIILSQWSALSCVKNPVTGKREFHMISESAELRLGQDTKNEIVKEYGLYLNPAVQAYINEVGQKIAAVCERKNVTYEFVILDTPLVNAFAVPGIVFLTRGILELIDDEAELAAVIGHEVGHITGFHSVKIIQKAFGYQFLSLFATMAVAFYGPRADDPRAYAVIHQATNFVAAGFLNGYGREFELEADRSGLKYAILAGYDPDAMISFFKRMRALDEKNPHEVSIFLRTHPPSDVRIKQIKKILAYREVPGETRLKKHEKKLAGALKSTAAVSSDHFERYQEIVKSIPKIESENPGIIRDSIYENEALGVRLESPRGWKLEYGYGKSLASLHSSDGKAQAELQMKKVFADPVLAPAEGTAVAGVASSTAGVSSRQWAESLEEGLKLEKRSGRDISYPAGQSYVGTYKGRDRVGRPAFYKILFIVCGGNPESQNGFLLSGAAPEDSYLDYLVDFEKIMKSFRCR